MPYKTVWNHDSMINAKMGKEVWYPATVANRAGYVPLNVRGVNYKYPSALLQTANDYAAISFVCPNDFNSIVEANIIVIPDATQAAADWDITTNYGAIGQSDDVHTGSNTASTYNVTADVFFNVDIASCLSSLAANDIVGIVFTLNDSTHDVAVMGLRFRYS